MTVRRFMLVLLGTLMAWLAAPLPAQADVGIYQAFSADSGDRCPYGITRGDLTWRFAGSTTRAVAVQVTGSLTDRPTPNDPAVCADDRRFSVATFTVYSGNTAVARVSPRADNQTIALSFVMGPYSTVAGITRLVIQVCRHTSTVPSYCGRAVEYRPVP